MKRSDLKVGETYVSAGVGYDREHFSGKVAILLDPNVEASRNGFDYRLRRPTPNLRTGKVPAGNKVLVLMESGYGEKRVARHDAEKFRPSAEWIDRWLVAFKPWPSEREKREREELRNEIPEGWSIDAVSPARLWMTWAEFTPKRKAFKDAEVVREQDRLRQRQVTEGAREELEKLAEGAGLHSFTVGRDARTITLPAEQFRALIK